MATGGRGSLHWFGHLSRSQSKFLNALNPFNYISMGTVLNLAGFPGTSGTRHNKPMFVNFLMATNVFDMPAALFSPSCRGEGGVGRTWLAPGQGRSEKFRRSVSFHR